MPEPLSPTRVMDLMLAYQQSDALKAAIDLDLFTAIAEGHATIPAIAKRCQASERGARILADYWTVHGLLTRQDGHYDLQPEASAFLNRNSPAFMGALTGFLGAPNIRRQFQALSDAVRKGGVASDEAGSTAEEYVGWLDFARSMTAMMAPAAAQMAALLSGSGALSVLDVAASHGLFGISIAQANPQARITALDWPNVLEITRSNAIKAGIGDRFHAIPGDAFAVDLAGPYDLILLPNLLHHFDRPAIVRLLKRMRAALGPGGQVATLEFVPNEDRISPPVPAGFALVMLASTPAGDAYPFSEFRSMFEAAGFANNRLVELAHTPESLILSRCD